ncbi:MAG: hypothetical protein KDD69_19425, partial [Bdellovibrionales bacterium]|nr:hypothetical protein [Bdellovibrionales bacterium]
MVADQLVALVNEPSERMCHEGLCTFINRKSFSHSQALREHREFCSALEGVGIPVRDLRINADCPDAAFVEDNARVFDDGHLLLASMTHPARRAEMAGWEQVLEMDREFRSLFSNITFLYREDEDARIEFGDVLSVGRRHFVGLSTRTNRRGYELFSDFVRQYGHETVPVECTKALHLDTAVARINENTVLL